jgi:hypothetical protein
LVAFSDSSMRTDTITFCDGWNILAHLNERSNSEEQEAPPAVP